MMGLLRKYLFLAGCLACLTDSGLARDNRIAFERITSSNGLLQNDIIATVQDSTGFLWFATHNGLCRYDGYDFVYFKNRYDSSNTIGSNVLLSMACDHEGHIWIGTKDGLDCYDPRFDRFINFRDSLEASGERMPNYRVAAIYVGNDGIVWFSVNNRLYAYRGDRQFDFNVIRNKKGRPQPSYIFDICEAPFGQLYVATNRGVYLYNPKTGASNLFFLPSSVQDGASDKLNVLYADISGGQLLAGGDAGLFRLGRDGTYSGEIDYEGTPVRRVSAVCRDSRRRLWIGTEDNGLYLLEKNSLIHLLHDARNPGSLSSNEILSIFEDRSGVMWVGTSTGGVNKCSLRKKKFLNLPYDPFRLDGLSDNVVRSVYADTDSVVWIGTKEGVLNRWDLRSGEIDHYPLRFNGRSGVSCRILSIYPKSDTDLWIGCGMGLFRFDKSRRRFSQVPEAADLIHNFVGVLATDAQGDLWCGTIDGIFVFRNDRLITRYNTMGLNGVPLSDNRVTAICRGRQGEMWVGTRDGGLNCLVPQGDTYKSICYIHDRSNPGSISYNDISSILEDSKGRLWAGTWGGGLNLLDSAGKFHTYTEEDGLADNVVFSIHEDGEGKLWLSTYNGLSCLCPETGTFTNYSSYDGTGNDEYMQGAAFRSPDGMLYLGGLNGLTVFRPGEIKPNMFRPQVAITALRLYNNEVRVGDESLLLEQAIYATDRLVLPYGKRNFTFDFAAFSYAAPVRNRFAYKLEGFDEQWIYTAPGGHSASYANLNPGNYVFLLRGSDSDGAWSDTPVRLKIRITPPFWMSTWAYLFYFVVAGLLLWLILRYYRHRAELRNAMLKERLQLEGQQKLYDSKMRFYINVSHELRTPLTLILGLIDRVSAKLGPDNPVTEQIAVMKKNADLLLRRINELLTIRKLETQHMKAELKNREVVSFIRAIVSLFEEHVRTRNLQLSFRSDLDSFNMDLDPEKTEKIIYNLLSNAVKFTHSYIDVSLGIVTEGGDRKLCISVRDDGCGISPEDQTRIFDRFYQCEGSESFETGTGIGLNMAQELAHVLGGEISVESEPGQGSTFLLRLPITGVADLPADNNGGQEEENEKQPILLVIDDNSDMLYYMKELLSEQYDVRTVRGGVAGLETARQIIPDIILSDVMMPDIEGTDLCQRLKSDTHTSHIPIILVTAKHSEESRVRGLELGADAYITKPFTEKHLKAQIASTLQLREDIRRQLHREILMTPTKVSAESAHDKLLSKVVTQIEKHISDENYDVDALCRDVGISRMHLYRKLKGLVGQTPGDLIRDFRVKRAADLLMQNKFSVSEISYMVGFGDPKYLRLHFRKKYGVTPSEYLENLVGKHNSKSGNK